ncbi:hypothetical protein [Phenylobacterium montanum]|uniref:VanZ family protein n=1 Tax=Phenylobacterium montanum TaxID=2823693 RepID=A0A975ITD8_9CAUL|nr:hypothetical protein [Caulobacter sp. S6]QUD86762.1 hypothetical protein KCG34_17005 [Caulobacter sp. S6]
MQRLSYYPDNGPWAVAARLGFLISLVAVSFAALAPAGWVPRLLFSRHLEHFAAFYVATVMACAALPRARLMHVGLGMTLFAVGLELLRVLPSQNRAWAVEAGQADIGGVLAALAPIVVERFRSWFDPRETR